MIRIFDKEYPTTEVADFPNAMISLNSYKINQVLPHAKLSHVKGHLYTSADIVYDITPTCDMEIGGLTYKSDIFTKETPLYTSCILFMFEPIKVPVDVTFTGVFLPLEMRDELRRNSFISKPFKYLYGAVLPV